MANTPRDMKADHVCSRLGPRTTRLPNRLWLEPSPARDDAVSVDRMHNPGTATKPAGDGTEYESDECRDCACGCRLSRCLRYVCGLLLCRGQGVPVLLLDSGNLLGCLVDRNLAGLSQRLG